MTEQLPRGTVTILFTDTVDSTALAATVGDRRARERMRAREELAREQLALHDGREIEGTGDGMMAAFMSARSAVACAIGIQQAVHKLNLARPRGTAQLRIGVHCGEVFPERGDLHGSAVNAAACGRLWDEAESHFEKALRQADELPNRLDQPDARRWFAWMLLKRSGPGDRERAASLLGDAVRLYDELGMPQHRKLAEALSR